MGANLMCSKPEKKASVDGVLKEEEWSEVLIQLEKPAISSEPCEPLEAYVTVVVRKHHLVIVQAPCSFLRL